MIPPTTANALGRSYDPSGPLRALRRAAFVNVTGPSGHCAVECGVMSRNAVGAYPVEVAHAISLALACTHSRGPLQGCRVLTVYRAHTPLCGRFSRGSRNLARGRVACVASRIRVARWSGTGSVTRTFAPSAFGVARAIAGPSWTLQGSPLDTRLRGRGCPRCDRLPERRVGLRPSPNRSGRSVPLLPQGSHVLGEGVLCTIALLPYPAPGLSLGCGLRVSVACPGLGNAVTPRS